MSIRSRLSSPKVQTAIVVVLGVLLLWLFFRGSDLQTIRKSLASARPGMVGTAVVLMLGSYVVRALRWRVLLSPLGDPSVWNCFSTTVIGFMVNVLVPPGRVGEIARPFLLARREGFAASSAFATIIVERVLDLVTVVLLIGGWLGLGPEPASSEEAVGSLELGGLLGLAGAAAALAVLFSLARWPGRILPWLEWIFGVLPKKIGAAALRFTESFAEGLGILVDGWSFFRAAAWSVVLWMNIALAFWVGARSLDVNFSYGDTFLVIGFLTIGVAVPTPGAIGGYHLMGALALTMLFGTDESLARAVAILNHAVSFLPVTFLGIVLFAKAGLSFGQVKTMSKSSRRKDEP